LIRVGVVATAAAVRLGLREILRELTDVEVTSDASTLLGLGEMDILILASPMLLAELPEGTPPVLLLTEDIDRAEPLFNLPVWGMLPLDSSVAEILAALQALAEGLTVASPGLLNHLVERRLLPAFENAEEVLDPLTSRERQILQMAAEGLANKEIAGQLQISEHTVKYHLSTLYSKLGVSSRTEAVRAGMRKGWVVL